jgi:predicted nucleic acid-binding protein
VRGFLLDTNVVSALRKAEPGNPVRRWRDEHLDDDHWLSVLVVAELDRGVRLVARRDRASGQRLGRWLDSVVTEFSDRILPVSLPVSRRWAALSVPDPLPVVDGLLAATAVEHGLTFVTRNARDVARTGVAVIDPFEG